MKLPQYSIVYVDIHYILNLTNLLFIHTILVCCLSFIHSNFEDTFTIKRRANKPKTLNALTATVNSTENHEALHQTKPTPEENSLKMISPSPTIPFPFILQSSIQNFSTADPKDFDKWMASKHSHMYMIWTDRPIQLNFSWIRASEHIKGVWWNVYLRKQGD